MTIVKYVDQGQPNIYKATFINLNLDLSRIWLKFSLWLV